MSEELVFSFRFSAIGIIIVFSALSIIAATIYYASKLEKYFANRNSSAKSTDTSQSPPESTIDNTTLVLISAAVATMIQGRFHVKRVRRLMPGNHINSSWAVQGLAILHGSHVIRKNK